jgi:hypothetical protein
MIDKRGKRSHLVYENFVAFSHLGWVGFFEIEHLFLFAVVAIELLIWLENLLAVTGILFGVELFQGQS